MVAEHRLSEVLSEFARTVATDVPIQGLLDHLVKRIVDLLPVDGACHPDLGGRRTPHVSASDSAALRFERLQTQLGDGPCLAAYDTDAAILVPDLGTDHRFPAFAQHAVPAGLAAVFTFPLRDGRQGLGALDLYRSSPGHLGVEDLAAAQTLADVAAAYLINARARCDLQVAAETERASLARFRELDVAKTEFVASVIHELRTPMTSISGYSEMLGEAAGLTSQQRKMMGAINRNCRRLEALADDLLTLSSFEPGSYQGQRRDVDLASLVSDVRRGLPGVLAGRDLRMSYDLPAGLVTVRGDHLQLERMVSNLVVNAVKFTPDGGSVEVALRVAEGQACLTVSDSGIGIPQDEQDLLFTRFFRSSTAHQYAIHGSGLGLAIVWSIVASHGGAVTVVSEPMHGTTFTVTLPLSLPQSLP